MVMIMMMMMMMMMMVWLLSFSLSLSLSLRLIVFTTFCNRSMFPSFPVGESREAVSRFVHVERQCAPTQACARNQQLQQSWLVRDFPLVLFCRFCVSRFVCPWWAESIKKQKQAFGSVGTDTNTDPNGILLTDRLAGCPLCRRRFPTEATSRERERETKHWL